MSKFVFIDPFLTRLASLTRPEIEMLASLARRDAEATASVDAAHALARDRLFGDGPGQIAYADAISRASFALLLGAGLAPPEQVDLLEITDSAAFAAAIKPGAARVREKLLEDPALLAALELAADYAGARALGAAPDLTVKIIID